MKCPVCQEQFKPEETVAMPFCSERCRTIDLGRWLDEGYSVPEVPNIEADEVPDDDWSQEKLSSPDIEAS